MNNKINTSNLMVRSMLSWATTAVLWSLMCLAINVIIFRNESNTAILTHQLVVNLLYSLPAILFNFFSLYQLAESISNQQGKLMQLLISILLSSVFVMMLAAGLSGGFFNLNVHKSTVAFQRFGPYLLASIISIVFFAKEIIANQIQHYSNER